MKRFSCFHLLKVVRMAAKEIVSKRRKMMSEKISQWECSIVIVAYSVFSRIDGAF
jgi:hypothetical protein